MIKNARLLETTHLSKTETMLQNFSLSISLCSQLPIYHSKSFLQIYFFSLKYVDEYFFFPLIISSFDVSQNGNFTNRLESTFFVGVHFNIFYLYDINICTKSNKILIVCCKSSDKF